MNGKKNPKKPEGTEVKVRDMPVSQESLTLPLRLGVSSNYMNLFKVSSDEVQLDFIKITVSEKSVHKDLVARVNLSNENAKALRDLLVRQIQ